MLFVLVESFRWVIQRQEGMMRHGEHTQKTRSPLETELLSRLLLRYAVPTTLILMVNYRYNVVDQIFIGHGAEITGMAAVNVAFPISILVNAAALLLEDRCAAINAAIIFERKTLRTNIG